MKIINKIIKCCMSGLHMELGGAELELGLLCPTFQPGQQEMVPDQAQPRE